MLNDDELRAIRERENRTVIFNPTNQYLSAVYYVDNARQDVHALLSAVDELRSQLAECQQWRSDAVKWLEELENILNEALPDFLGMPDPMDWMKLAIKELSKGQQENARLRAALESIERWSRAYPLTVFPNPDYKLARELLEAGGMTLDSLSADTIRQVVVDVGNIAREALGKEGEK